MFSNPGQVSASHMQKWRTVIVVGGGRAAEGWDLAPPPFFFYSGILISPRRWPQAVK